MFTQLPTTTSAQLTDIICAVQGYISPSNPGLSVQETLGQVSALLNSNIILASFTNPNGILAGTIYQLCWDIGDHLLFVCTTTGNTSTAVWTPCIGQLTNGQLRIGSTGAAPSAATLTPGQNISITNTAGAITIASTGSASFSWTLVTGTTEVGLTNSGYIANNSGLVTISLPATSSVGDEFSVVGYGSGGWSISQVTGQQIHIGAQDTTAGATGSVSSSNQYDSVDLLCVVANTIWTTFTAPQGNLALV